MKKGYNTEINSDNNITIGIIVEEMTVTIIEIIIMN